MKGLAIYVPTYRRLNRQHTLSCLSKEWLNRTTVVCPKDEARVLGKMFPDLYRIQTPDVNKVPNIAAKRAWIFQTTPFDRIMMLDDDLQFSIRERCNIDYEGYQEGDPKEWPKIAKTYSRLLRAAPEDVGYILLTMETMLDDYRHGSIFPRFMNQQHGHEFILNHKCTHALAYHVPTILENCKLGRVRMFEDLDYTIQLLRRGYESAIYCWGAVNALGFNAPGGESENRTMADIARGADLMAKLHPGIVRVVERTGPDAERLGPKRIVVAWKRAIKEGRAK